MLIHTIVSPLAAENCYLIAADSSKEFLIIDPGQGSAIEIAKFIDEHNLNPAAILLTHGHVDHTWDVVPIADKYRISTYIHPLDRPQLSDPISWLSPQFAGFLRGIKFQEPHSVIPLTEDKQWQIADLTIEVRHVPGHSLGSLVFITHDTVFSGDTLFASSIGRTDLPGGNHEQLIAAINAELLILPDHYQVLSGHGPRTTIGTERQCNPFLV